MRKTAMNYGLRAAFFLTACVCPSQGEESGSLSFGNGGVIPLSALESVSQGSPSSRGLLFKVDSPLLKEAVIFDGSCFDSLKWNRDALSVEDYSIMTLKDGSSMMGRITGANGDMVEVETLWCKALTIDCRMISSTKITPYGKIYYEGTSSLKGWVTANGQPWVVKDNVFYNEYLSQPITREINLPAAFRLSLSFPTFGYLDMSVGLWRSLPKTPLGHFVELRIVGRSILIERHEDGKYTPVFTAVVPAETKMKSFDLFADRVNGRYAVYVNGKEIADEMIDSKPNEDAKDETNGSDAAKFGSCISLHMASRVGLSGLRVSGWDGQSLGESIDADETGPSPEKSGDAVGDDVVFLKNGDRLRGKVSFESGNLKVKSRHYDVKVPLPVISSFRLSAGDESTVEVEGVSAKSSVEALPVILAFCDGSKIRAGLCGMNNESVVFEIGGKAERFSSPLDLVSEIVFLKEDE